jgi:hypothetical protein
MRELIVLVACTMLVGCDYTVPLVKTPGMAIDNAVVGLWERTNENGQTERLLVLPLSKQEYLVSFPSSAKDAMFARASLCSTAGKTLVQLEWIGTVQGELPEDNRVFQFAAYSVAEDTLRVRMLNADVVKGDAESPGALAKAIGENKNNPALFRGEVAFKKVKN